MSIPHKEIGHLFFPVVVVGATCLVYSFPYMSPSNFTDNTVFCVFPIKNLVSIILCEHKDYFCGNFVW